VLYFDDGSSAAAESRGQCPIRPDPPETPPDNEDGEDASEPINDRESVAGVVRLVHLRLHGEHDTLNECGHAEKRKQPSDPELPALRRLLPGAYWITSSARPSSDGGIVRPRALAVLRLITSSNFVACCTGRSAGLAPFKIWTICRATRRKRSGQFTP
jgi:hypothetical protein